MPGDLDDDTLRRLVEAAPALLRIVEGITGAMEHGTWRDEHGMRLKDTPEWVAFYVAARRALATLPKPEEPAHDR